MTHHFFHCCKVMHIQLYVFFNRSTTNIAVNIMILASHTNKVSLLSLININILYFISTTERKPSVTVPSMWGEGKECTMWGCIFNQCIFTCSTKVKGLLINGTCRTAILIDGLMIFSSNILMKFHQDAPFLLQLWVFFYLFAPCRISCCSIFKSLCCSVGASSSRRCNSRALLLSVCFCRKWVALSEGWSVPMALFFAVGWKLCCLWILHPAWHSCTASEMDSSLILWVLRLVHKRAGPDPWLMHACALAHKPRRHFHILRDCD